LNLAQVHLFSVATSLSGIQETELKPFLTIFGTGMRATGTSRSVVFTDVQRTFVDEPQEPAYSESIDRLPESSKLEHPTIKRET